MKQVAVIVALIIFLMIGSGEGYAQQQITISSLDNDSFLFECVKRIMDEAYQRLGITLKIERLPGERSIQFANSGGVDGELFRINGIEKSYPELLRVPVNILSAEFVVFTKKEQVSLKGWQSLLPYCTAYIRGVKAIEQNIVEGSCTKVVRDYEQAFLMLDLGRVDFVIAAREQGQVDLKKLGLKNIRILEPALITIESFHYLHKKNQYLVQPLTAQLKQMEADGAIHKIQRQVYQSWPE